MKFHWFAEVTYPHLPKNFPELGLSSWVTTPRELMDPVKVGETFHMFIRLMQQADRDGFDGLAVNEHHQTPFAMSPSPNLMASALASTTENAAILIIGDSLALYNPPTRVAEEMAYMDCVSGGRAIAGFVFGTPMDSVFAYGNPPPELRDRFHEARNLIQKAWDAKEPFAFNGKYTKLRYVNTWPKPVQEKMPIWVPGSREYSIGASLPPPRVGGGKRRPRRAPVRTRRLARGARHVGAMRSRALPAYCRLLKRLFQ